MKLLDGLWVVMNVFKEEERELMRWPLTATR